MPEPTERVWTCDGEPRWWISKWGDGGAVFVTGPAIRPADDSLQGMEWVEAAKVEVVPAERVEELEGRIGELTEALERIAAQEDVSVNGEYIKRNQPVLSALGANEVARIALAPAEAVEE